MTLPYDEDIAAAAQIFGFMGGAREAAALSTATSFFCNMSTCCCNLGTSLQAAVPRMLGTLLILAKLFLCLFIWLGLQPATSGMLEEEMMRLVDLL